MFCCLTDVHICSSYLLRDSEITSWCSGSHVAQEMAALCSLAFIRSAAMLDDFRSGSMFKSYPLMPVLMPGLPNKLPICACPMWPPGLGTPKKSDTPLAACGWGGMQEVTESHDTTQPGTGDPALLLPIQEGFWICKKGQCRRLRYNAFMFCNFSNNNMKEHLSNPTSLVLKYCIGEGAESSVVLDLEIYQELWGIHLVPYWVGAACLVWRRNASVSVRSFNTQSNLLCWAESELIGLYSALGLGRWGSEGGLWREMKALSGRCPRCEQSSIPQLQARSPKSHPCPSTRPHIHNKSRRFFGSPVKACRLRPQPSSDLTSILCFFRSRNCQWYSDLLFFLLFDILKCCQSWWRGYALDDLNSSPKMNLLHRLSQILITHVQVWKG